MAFWYSVGIAGLLFLLYQWFQEEEKLEELNACKPMLPSVIVFIGVLGMMVDRVQLPQPLLYTACWLYNVLFEIIISIFSLYLSINVVWDSLEIAIVLAMRFLLCGHRILSEPIYKRYEEYWIGSITLPLSLIILVNISSPFFFMRVYLIRSIDSGMKYMERIFKKTKKAPKKRPAPALRFQN